MSTTIIGIDPGLVHMGAVAMTFDGTNLDFEAVVFDGQDIPGVKLWTRRRVRA